jgi:putative FmdB family regulatory protein
LDVGLFLLDGIKKFLSREGKVFMPIYEYLCQECGKVSSFIVLNIRDPYQPHCKRCQSRNMSKLISRVARVRSEESRLESLADPSKLGDLNENDPSSMARWMKRMGKEMGEDLGEDFDAVMDEAMEGEGKGGGGEASGEGEEL